MSTLYDVVEISYIRDEQDTVSNSILLRVTILPNKRGLVMFEPLFIVAKCKTLMEGDNVIWSSNDNKTNVEGFDTEEDLITGLMTVHIASARYEFQALWH